MLILLVAWATCISTILASVNEQYRSPIWGLFRTETLELDEVSDGVSHAKVISYVGVEYATGADLLRSDMLPTLEKLRKGISGDFDSGRLYILSGQFISSFFEPGSIRR
tara:strand:+ start:1315 stop:1641 length:327 start_codon:yes stop_codon:yes gene_type:complete